MTPEAAEHALPADRGRGAGGRVPRVQALPPRREPRIARVGHAGRSSSPARCAASPTASSTVRESPGSRAGSATACVRSSGRCSPRSAPVRWRSPARSGRRPRGSSSRRPTLDVSSIAWAAGFSSVRQFNATVQEVFATTPTELRARARAPRPAAREPLVAGGIDLRLPLREPFNVEGVFAHLVATAVPGVEEYVAETGTYRRVLRLPTVTGSWSSFRSSTTCAAGSRSPTCATSPPPSTAAAGCSTSTPTPSRSTRTSPPTTRSRHSSPRRRVDGCPAPSIPTELALRAVLGQQVSTRSARTHAARLVLACGEPLASARRRPDPLLPRSRRGRRRRPRRAGDAGVTDAQRCARSRPRSPTDRLVIDESCDRAELNERLRRVPGHRAVDGGDDRDARGRRSRRVPRRRPRRDLRGARCSICPSTRRALRARAERWRPWRSYAVQYLWGALDHPVSRLRLRSDLTSLSNRHERNITMHTYCTYRHPSARSRWSPTIAIASAALEFGESTAGDSSTRHVVSERRTA